MKHRKREEREGELKGSWREQESRKKKGGRKNIREDSKKVREGWEEEGELGGGRGGKGWGISRTGNGEKKENWEKIVGIRIREREKR